MRSILPMLGRCLVIAGLLISNLVIAEPQPVRVGGYVFPPFVETNPDGDWSGTTIDLIELLNASQERYRFEFIPTSATRRYRDFANGRFDLLFFESPQWGWQNHPVVGVRGPSVGGEVFIAASRPGRGQGYFAQRKGKRIAVLSGYHYAFAGYNPDKRYLRQQHDAIVTFSQKSSVQMVLRDRADLAVISQAFLERYLDQFPEYRSQLLIAAEPDQHYQHVLIKREPSEPELDYLIALLDRLEERGAMQELLARHGLLVSTKQ